jgi:hypothetical protein
MSARYSALLGKRIEVIYRSNDIYVPATGKLVADSGRSIFLEERLDQKGRLSTFRWEIPYGYISRLTEVPAPETPAHETKLLIEMEPEEQGSPSLRWRENPTES